MSARYDYTEWDGTQEFADLDPDDLLAGLTDDLLAGGDLDDALRRLLRSGFRTDDGEQVQGLRDLLEQLRRRRQEMLAEGDPDGRMAELGRQLDEIEQDERAAIDELVDEARQSGDQRRAEVTDDVATERRMALDLQPDDPAGRIQSLQHYDFVSSEARERFEELVEELRREMADTFFEGASDALSNMSPEQMARMRDAYDALNRMLEQVPQSGHLVAVGSAEPAAKQPAQRVIEVAAGQEVVGEARQQLVGVEVGELLGAVPFRVVVVGAHGCLLFPCFFLSSLRLR